MIIERRGRHDQDRDDWRDTLRSLLGMKTEKIEVDIQGLDVEMWSPVNDAEGPWYFNVTVRNGSAYELGVNREGDSYFARFDGNVSTSLVAPRFSTREDALLSAIRPLAALHEQVQ